MTCRGRWYLAAAAGCWSAIALASGDFGRAAFTDRRAPPAVRELDGEALERFDLGQLVFNSAWVEAGMPRAARRDGLGPLFNAASCDACHNNGARGRAPASDGVAPGSFVLQLGGEKGTYGHVLNTSALAGVTREGSVAIDHEPVEVRYADGAVRTLKAPRYRVVEPGYGALAGHVVLKPRVGPALFGGGLLEAVPESAITAVKASQPRQQRGARARGRFGWQADALSLREQTERALQREMGLTTSTVPQDDCTPAQSACLAATPGGEPEVSDEFLAALLTFQGELAVPTANADVDPRGAALFERIGCGVCHRASLPSRLADGTAVSIRPFTDLLIHDLGDGLADRRVDGRVVRTRWRTAPLWGIGFELARGSPALLHDGRARSVEEAILWHGGQGDAARRRFLALPASERAVLLRWVEAQ